MTQQVVQGPRSRQPLSSSEFRNHRLATWLRDTGPSWNATQSSETQGALHAHSSHYIAPPGSPLLSGSTTTSSCVSGCSPQDHIPVPQPLGLSDPASLTRNTRRSTALLAGTGTWFATISSRPKKSPEACCLEPPPQLRPEHRLNASFREIRFSNPDYAERLSRAIQDLFSEDRTTLLDQTLGSVPSLGGGDSNIQHPADSRRVSDGVTPATHKPTLSPGASNKRKTPPGRIQQGPGKAPDDNPGSVPGGGSASSPSQNKKSKTSDFLYLCPYRRVYHLMSPQNDFRSCQPPGHLKDRYDLKRHLQRVHVRTRVKQDSKAKAGNQASGPNMNPDYSMDPDLWNNKVVGIFENACSKRFKRGSEVWLQNERAFYQEIWKIILPNEPIPESPFYNSMNGLLLVDEAVQNREVVSSEDDRSSQEEAMNMTAIALAELLRTTPELSQRVNSLLQSHADSDHLPPLTEDTRSLTPATSSRNHIPSISQDLPLQPTTTPQPPEITHQTPFTCIDADHECGAFHGMAENTQPETPSMVFLDTPLNNILARPQPARTISKNQVYVCVDIEPPTFEVILRGCKASSYTGPQQWDIPVPAGLMVTVEPLQSEGPLKDGESAMCANLEPGACSLNSQLQSTGDGSFVFADISPNIFEGVHST